MRPTWVDAQMATVSGADWWFWPALLRYGAPALSLFGRVRVSSTFDPALLRGPLLVAANHVGNFDSFLVAVACRRVGMVPKFLVARGVMTAPVVGPAMTRAGQIRVDRGSPDARYAMEVTAAALRNGGHVVAYPEGRISLDPDLWPERGRTGLARLALHLRIPVLPLSQWGAHEVTAYDQPWAMACTTLGAIWRQPRLAVHVGAPVPLDDLDAERRGDAVRAARRIMAAITAGLVPLRLPEPDAPRWSDPTRPVAPRATAAFPGGRVPPGLLDPRPPD